MKVRYALMMAVVLLLGSLTVMPGWAVEPGERKTVDFTLTSEDLASYDIDMNLGVEPGIFEVMIGSSSEDIRLKGNFEVK